MTESSSSDTGFTREAGGGDEARAAPARALNSVATTGGTNESRSTSNLASDAAGAVVQPQEITRDGMAGSGRMSGGGTDPVLRRRSSSSSRRIQPLPLSSAAAATVDQISFDPQLLLQEGLDEWQDRARDLRNLRRAASIRQQPASSAKTTPSKTPSFRFQERSQSARRHSYESNGDTEGSTHGAVQYSTGDPGERDGDQFLFSEASEDGLQYGLGRGPRITTPGFETPSNVSSGVQNEGLSPAIRERDEEGDHGTADIPHELYAALAEAPQASLIHIVGLYHQVLLEHGLVQEAERIMSKLGEFQSAIDSVEAERELQGMDLLLKDGLLKYLLQVSPLLPAIPPQIVKFKGLTLTKKMKVEAGYDTMFTKVQGIVKSPLSRSHIEEMAMLKGVTGYIMPGTLTLIMGPPGCGKSNLIRLLAGRSTGPGTALEGRVTYNGRNVQDIRCQRLAAMVSAQDIHLPALTVRETLEFARDCTQAHRTKHYGDELKQLMGEALKHGQDPKLEMNLSMVGLKRVAGRPVGSPMRPSLTADEQHRLTIAEVVAGTYAAYFIDQLNQGADEAMTFDLVTSMRIIARVRQISVVGSILQPSSEVFQLFDRIIVLDGGQIMFQGPRQDALPYFESLGYVKPKNLSISEFLSEVTTPEGAHYLQPGYPKLMVEEFAANFLLSPTFRDIHRVVNSSDLLEELWVEGNQPLGLGFTESRANNNGTGIVTGPGAVPSMLVAGVIEKGGSLAEPSISHTSVIAPGDEVVAVGGNGDMLKYFKTYDHALDNSLTGGLASAIDHVVEPVRLQLERPFQETKGLPIQFDREYILDLKPEMILLLKRELKVAWRNKLGFYLRLMQILIMSLYTGIVFFRVHNNPNQLDLNLLKSVFFISLLNLTLFNLGQLPGLLDERALYYKQQDAHFYRPLSYLFAKIVGGFPLTLFETTIWTLIVYFMTGLSLEDGGWHFWVYYIIATLTALNGASLVRFMAYFAPTRDAANALIGVFVAIFIVFAGFLVPRFIVRHYWIWAYYIDPLQWAITALMLNEFNSKTYSLPCSEVPDVVTNLPQCVGRPTNTIGHAYLARGQFYTSNSWIAVGIAVVVGWIVLFNVGAYFCLAKLRHVPRRNPFLEMKLATMEQHQVAKDEEWASAERKLSHSAVPITLSWHELSYDILIPTIGQTRAILSHVSGWGKPGDMVALLGSYESGKTTLLNCLAGRKISLGRIGGQILVNGYPKVQKTFTHVEGYVEDLGSHAPYMTVRESIEFSAALRLGKKFAFEKRKEFVEEILELMQINHVSDMLINALVGHEENSREQAIRLAIATELAGNPSILFLDLPTKGLDSHNSGHIVECLKRIADTGRMVISTLQSPSIRQISAFTRAQILKKGGETVYFGPVGTDGELIQKYFEAIPGTPLCLENQSPVNYAISVIGDGVNDLKSLRDYAFEFRVSDLALQTHIEMQQLRRGKGQQGPDLVESGYRAPFPLMAKEILLKMQRFYWRNVNYNFGRMTSALGLGLILGSVYFNITPDTNVKMNVKSQSLFIICVLLGVTNASNVIPQILTMSATLERETNTNQYNVLLYNIGWTLGEIPYLATSTMIFCFVFCLMAQIAVHSAAQFFRFYFVLFEFTLAVTFLGALIVVASPLPQIAAVLVPIVIGFWTATGGSVVPKKKILNTVIWIFWTNPIQYALNSLTSITFFCDTNKPECLNNGANMACLNSPAACAQCSCPRVSDLNNVFVWTQLQFNRSLNNARIPIDMLVLAMFVIFFRFVTAVLLYFRMKRMQTK